MSDDDFDEESAMFTSRTVDVSALPSDSLIRVTEMSRARRARLLADEESWVQEGKFKDKMDEYLEHELKIISADEDSARGVASKQEEKARDRHQRAFAEQTLQLQDDVSRLYERQKFDSKKEAEIRRLKEELHRKAFQGFWEQEKMKHRQSSHSSPGNLNDEGSAHTTNQATNILRVAYANSLPPFITDPEEAWRRGVTVAPDLQRNNTTGRYSNADDTTPLQSLNLPSFHEYAKEVTNKYSQWQQQQQDQAQQRYLEQVRSEQDALLAQQEYQLRQQQQQQSGHRHRKQEGGASSTTTRYPMVGGQDFSLHPLQQREQQMEHAAQQLAYQKHSRMQRSEEEQLQTPQSLQSPQSQSPPRGQMANYHLAFPQHFQSPR